MLMGLEHAAPRNTVSFRGAPPHKLCTISELDSDPGYHYCNFKHLTRVISRRWHISADTGWRHRLIKIEKRYHAIVSNAWLTWLVKRVIKKERTLTCFFSFHCRKLINSSLQIRKISAIPKHAEYWRLFVEASGFHYHWNPWKAIFVPR